MAAGGFTLADMETKTDLMTRTSMRSQNVTSLDDQWFETRKPRMINFVVRELMRRKDDIIKGELVGILRVPMFDDITDERPYTIDVALEPIVSLPRYDDLVNLLKLEKGIFSNPTRWFLHGLARMGIAITVIGGVFSLGLATGNYVGQAVENSFSSWSSDVARLQHEVMRSTEIEVKQLTTTNQTQLLDLQNRLRASWERGNSSAMTVTGGGIMRYAFNRMFGGNNTAWQEEQREPTYPGLADASEEKSWTQAGLESGTAIGNVVGGTGGVLAGAYGAYLMSRIFQEDVGDKIRQLMLSLASTIVNHAIGITKSSVLQHLTEQRFQMALQREYESKHRAEQQLRMQEETNSILRNAAIVNAPIQLDSLRGSLRAMSDYDFLILVMRIIQSGHMAYSSVEPWLKAMLYPKLSQGVPSPFLNSLMTRGQFDKTKLLSADWSRPPDASLNPQSVQDGRVVLVNGLITNPDLESGRGAASVMRAVNEARLSAIKLYGQKGADDRSQRAIRKIVEDSLYAPGPNVESKPMSILSPGEYLGASVDLFAAEALDQRNRKNPHYQKGLEIFNLLATQAGYGNLNTWQTQWLFRWMGPMCSGWLSEAENDAWIANPDVSINKRVTFVSVTCRKRFAFLKAMMFHSLLFLFLKQSEAELLVKKGDRRCIGSSGLRNGECLVILDSTRPGYFRIVGKNGEGTLTSACFDVAELNFTIRTRDSDSDWEFNHNEVVVALMEKALDGPNFKTMVTNDCWKAANMKLSEVTFPDMSALSQQFPKSVGVKNCAESLLRIYNQSRSIAVASLIRYLTKITPAGQEGSTGSYELDGKNLLGLNQAAAQYLLKKYPNTDDRSAKPQSGQPLPGGVDQRLLAFKGNVNVANADRLFMDAVTAHCAVDKARVGELEESVRTEWLALANDWRQTFPRLEREPTTVRVNTMCVNPMALHIRITVPLMPNEIREVRPDNLVIYGDAWFLQSVWDEFSTYSGVSVEIKRMKTVQKKVGEYLQVSHEYLQGLLYNRYWRPETFSMQLRRSS